jgi:putative glycerol-1-phosphate prenyltransferase
MLRDQVKGWRHIFKLDPAKELSDHAIQLLAKSGTDAFVIGGTDNVTYHNTSKLLTRLMEHEVPCFQEISAPDSLVPGFKGYLAPTVLNTNDAHWVLGVHYQTIKNFGSFIPWNQVILEAYVVLNPAAKVTRLTHANTELEIEDIVAYAQMAEWLQVPIYYVEYSGTYGRAELVQAASAVLQQTRLCYGGGITNRVQAIEMATWADIVVVGNLIYQDIVQAIHTVNWVKTTEKRGE